MTPAIDNYSEHLGLPLFTAHCITLVYIVNCCTPPNPPSHPLYPAAAAAIMYLESFVPEFMYTWTIYAGFCYCQKTCPSACCPPLKVQNTNQLIERYVWYQLFSTWYIHHIFVATSAHRTVITNLNLSNSILILVKEEWFQLLQHRSSFL